MILISNEFNHTAEWRKEICSWTRKEGRQGVM
jgi:hypothetical protein